MFALNNRSDNDTIGNDFALDFSNQTDTSYGNKTNNFIFDVDWIPTVANKTDHRKNEILEKN